MTGILVRSLSGFYDVDVDGREIRCRARGKFRYQKIKPLVGDWVELTLLGETEGVVDAVLPRRNAMDRPAVAIPVTDPFLIDRMTAIAEAKRCEPIVLFNKWDLQPVPQLLELYQRAGIRALACSAKTGEGLAELRQIIAGKISVFTGNSGVGKSSLLNALDSQRIRDYWFSTGTPTYLIRLRTPYNAACGAVSFAGRRHGSRYARFCRF